LPLANGTRIGPYLVVAPRGAGGLGAVYRATDTNLKRQVALKVLPESFAGDAGRIARFQREAEVLAALNHPHIAQIFGIEKAAGMTALAMELVEGEDLSLRIWRGALPLDEALPVARQIAEALEAAHDRGVVHRDLKPSNIKVRADGTVKVLDFGLSKTFETSTAGATPSDSPTITSPAMTTPGLILGTAAYMAPEQAKAKPVDRRADLWALGAVVYEMLTAQRAFAGEDTTDTIVAVLSKEPDWTALPANTPAPIRTLLRRCLEKDRRRRLDSAAAVRLEIDDVLSGASEAASGLVPPASARPVVPWVVAVALGATLLATVTAWAPWRPDPTPPETRLDVVTPVGGEPTSFALSPDGRQIVFAAPGDLGVGLWLRDLAVSAARPLSGTEDATYPFWSPDGRSIGFFASGMMKRVDLAGGAPQTLARAPVGRGGTWHADGNIIFSPDQSSPLMRVAASGGEPVPATRLEPQQRSHRWPHLLPSGREILYASGETGIFLKRLDSDAAVGLTRDADSAAVYLPSGWLMWVRRGTLVAQRLDVAQATLTGEPVTIADGFEVDLRRGAVSVASNGSFAYRLSTPGRRQLTWVDRTGRIVGAVGSPDANDLRNPRIAPDGRRVAASRRVEGNTDIWLFEGSRTSRLTFDDALDMHPTWSADGSRIAFTSTRSDSGQADLYQMAPGAAGDRLLFASAQTKTPNAWSPDGRFFLFYSTDPQTANDLWLLPAAGSPVVFLKTPFREGHGVFSPDGRWVAYTSDQSGRMEVYVRPFNPTLAANGSEGNRGREWQVSIDGGIHPTWSPNGREVYFLSPAGEMMAVPVAVTGSAVALGTPARLFPTTIFGGGLEQEQRQYDVAPDGRFLINTVLGDVAAPITLVSNWNHDARR
jgi:eukaryotic-like serine/threonine-protein kinase